MAYYKDRAFTLLEISVVVMILAILVTISTPMFLVHIQRSRAAEAVASMSLIRQAEREYFSRHNAYLNVNTPNLTADLDINVGTAQFFSNAAYSVDYPVVTSHFTNPVDFVIKTKGGDSVQCSGSLSDCAVRQTEVAAYELEMDNSGSIVVCYKNCADNSNWQTWYR